MHEYVTAKQSLDSKIWFCIYTLPKKRILIQNSSALHFSVLDKNIKNVSTNTYLLKVNIGTLEKGAKYVQS